ncbi:hypothetical protein BG000_004375 [Podila horticola]|nr:hypothetical protein BG000_004375 [Podila horticola]
MSQRHSEGDSALSASSSTSSTSMTTATDRTVYIVVAAAVVVAAIALCVFFVKKRQLPRHGAVLSPSTSIRSARVSVVPQLQPPETPTTLSTFTRIPHPQMPGTTTYPRGRAKEFSLARLFTRSTSTSTSGPSRPVSEMSTWWDHGLRKSISLSSHPHSLASSTRSSQLYWDLNYPSGSYMKERKGDGFPVIMLTSPSDASIPLREDPELAQLCPHTVTDDSGPSSSTSSSNTSENDVSGASSDGGTGVGTLFPSHMFLHPSSSYARHEKRVAHEPSIQEDKPSDFPPTYEEAIDRTSNTQASSSSSSLSPRGSSDTTLPISIPSCTPLTGERESSSSGSIIANDERVESTPEYVSDDPKCIIIVDGGQDLEGDPLSTLFLRHG